MMDKPSVNHRPGEAGFGMTLIAVVIAITMGLATSMYLRQLSSQTAQFEQAYAGSQAHWAAISGMEWGFFKSEVGEANLGGPFSFFNSIISLDTSETDENGAPLAEFRYRVLSQGTFGSARRNFSFQAKMSMKTVWGDVSIIEGSGDLQIRNGMTINDTLYIGQNVDIQVGTAMGDPPGAQTLLYIPPGKVVTGGQEDANFQVGEHPLHWLFSPDFDTGPYDSLLGIALAITSTGGNKFNGNKTLKSGTLDLSIYEDSTIYINGDLKLQGMWVTGGSPTQPGIIVASDDLYMDSRFSVETIVDDNIIMIAGDILELDDATYYGTDQSALTPENRPNRHNEVFGLSDVIVRSNATLWGQAYATDDIQIDGGMHGIAYAPDNFRFTKPTSFLEGAIFATDIIGSAGPNRMDAGVFNMNHYFHEEYFKTYDFGVIEATLKEY